MKHDEIAHILTTLLSGQRTLESVASQLADSTTTPITGDSGSVEVRVDHDRAQRCGFAEVIFAQGKTPEQVVAIIGELLQRTHTVLATRASAEHVAAVTDAFPSAIHHKLGRIIVVRSETITRPTAVPEGLVVVVSAGTADLPVAEEAALCCEVLGARTERLYDVGVAGLHRALAHADLLKSARVVIAVAGMEGALPSVIAGLVKVPVVAVPTSVGYGAHLDGFAPLLTMLNSCAGGIGVVNIDNGYGAAVLACKINSPKWASELKETDE